MAKANINSASRDELVEAGVRAEIADEIVKLRRTHSITSPEELEEVQGVGPATLEQLRKALDFKEPEQRGKPQEPAHNGERRERESGAGEPTRAAVEAARSGAAMTSSAARSSLRITGRTVDAASDAQREVASRSAEGARELGQVILELMREQAQQNLETWSALSKAVDWEQVAKAADWDRVLEIQAHYLRASLERSGRLTQRCLAVGQAMVTAASTIADRGSQRAA
jgi:competence protein ComEA